MNDTWINLGGGYVYKTDSDLRWITTNFTTNDGIYPNILEYVHDDNFILVLQQPVAKGYQYVLSQDLRNRYSFVLYDLPDTSKYDIYEKRFLKSHLWLDSNIHKRMIKETLPDNQSSFENISTIADSIIQNDPYYVKSLKQKRQYWIIKKNEKLIIGPFSFQEYQNKRVDLKVPTNLVLKNI